ncbi:MAG: PD-(D/E)XK nuclease family protein [Marinisporobacter sp.]|nr:PD-(D/E)XK nuclease family protein [Marinisporobacter sp.]
MTHKKLYLSNSSIQVFLDCQLRFKNQYIDKLKVNKSPPNKYLSFGQSMHETLAGYNMITSEKHRTLENLHNLLRRNWIREGYDSIEEERSFGLKGLDMLTNYYHDPQDQGKKSLIIEEFIKKDINERFVLCGKLDKVYVKNDDKIEVLDYKTGQKIEPINLIQLPIYLLLAKEKLGAYPHTVSFYYLAHNKKIVQEVTRDFLKESLKIINSIYKQIHDEKDFAANPTLYCKNNCPYFESCSAANDRNNIILNTLIKNESVNKISRIF